MFPHLLRIPPGLDDRSEGFAVDSGEPWKGAWETDEWPHGQPDSVARLFRNDPSTQRRIALFRVMEDHQPEADRDLLWRALRLLAELRFRGTLAERKVAEHLFEPRRPVTLALTPDSEFLPSPELTEFWIRGLRDHLEEFALPERSKRRWLGELEQPHARKALAIRLKRLLAVVANRQAYGIEPQRPLAERGKFSLIFQHHILDRLPLRPDEYAEFFTLLYEEITLFLKAGGQMHGAWGRLLLEQSSIRVQYAKRVEASPLPEGWSRAKVLK